MPDARLADILTAFPHARLLRRRFPHMTFLAEAIPCPYCQAPVGEPCKTRTGGSTSFPHTARFEDFDRAE